MSNLVWEERPWGKFTIIHAAPEHTVKILRVNPREALSLQYHSHRDEFWTLLGNPNLNNRPNAIINGTSLTMTPGVRYSVPRTVLHRIVHRGSSPVEILEVAVGVFDENDIVRVNDKYGR